jgi:hydrogenase nickel incorporation protein HypB
MCVVCGCGHDGEHAALPAAAGAHSHGPADVVSPGAPALRLVQIEADVLGANQRLAERNRAHFAAHGVAAFNLLSSPGSGKTSLLCATIAALQQRAPQRPLAVIEGDQQTQLDAERIRAAGAPAVQVNTGRGCHLDARMVGEAFERLPLHGHGHRHEPPGGPARALLFIENVGNLVCPALWDLGEAAKVVILSVTEGEDKPLKYPDMFAAATLLVLNKTDLLPYLDFDVARCIDAARRLNPAIEMIQLSARTGQGMDAWLQWLEQRMSALPAQAPHARA